MNELEMWVDDLLGTFKENPSSEAMTLIESCGKCCAERNNHLEGILKLREVAAGCKTRSEYAKTHSRKNRRSERRNCNASGKRKMHLYASSQNF